MTTPLSHHLLRLIDDLGLSPGERLPPERDLAQKFRVSRGSIREAVKHLAAQGVVESRRGAGTFVVSSPQAFTRAMGAALAGARAHLDRLFELRLVVEPGIAALAARKATDAHMEAIREAIAAQAAEADPRRWGARDMAVHHAIAQATENPLVPELLAATAAAFTETREEALQSPARHHASVAGHHRILEALLAHDPAAAAKAMEDHILWAHALTQLPSKEDCA
ncbi:GntR family transcriptional regulator [Thermodesulfomicrobium sp. WS]|uniref:FadR/GntR family transcriptional regulator n=1 Tax=Thermodesulfomicrobium sp. WS TaxID=3004129 RepID=UPI002492A1DB|nr:FCD domain-containing protein [Thermodesulfomicrobium sp. WS]BDV02061.1 GntR family transcriptional regulator [Thermodesulfomicrobium sp. WS]